MSEPSNADRRAWARAALDAYEASHRADPDMNVQDLITDLLHVACAEGEDDIDALLRRAHMHFEAEEQEGQ
jgi:hypothetical protein